MRLLAGLGNPGVRYRGTRHNVGFDAVDLVLATSGARWNAATSRAVSADIVLENEPLTLLKPLTFMNLSGSAVADVVNAKSIAPHELLVLYDDVALPLGALRLRERGSDGGHNGLASVLEALGETDVPRLRIGIRPQSGQSDPADLAEFVLSPFDEQERPVIDAALRRVVEATRTVLTDGFGKAMSRFNRPMESD